LNLQTSEEKNQNIRIDSQCYLDVRREHNQMVSKTKRSSPLVILRPSIVLRVNLETRRAPFCGIWMIVNMSGQKKRKKEKRKKIHPTIFGAPY
jgi:hypothetical protein